MGQYNPDEYGRRTNGTAGDDGLDVEVRDGREDEKCRGGGGGEVVFLIDGFPRSMDRIALFESTISAPSLVLSLDCPLHILQERLLCRAESSSRVDDGVAIMQKRFEQHVCATKPVIAHYKERGLVVEIDGGRSVEAVQEDIRGGAGESFGAVNGRGIE